MSYANNFIKILKIASLNSNTSSNSSLGNLIMGPNRGFSIEPPFECLSWDSWKTKSSSMKTINYFDQYPEPIVIDMYLGEIKSFDAIGIWPSRENTGITIREFSLQFSQDEKTFTNPIRKVARQRNPHDLEIFDFNRVKASIIRLTIYSNYSHLKLRNNRVSCREITVIDDYRKIQTAINEAKSDICNYDFTRNLIEQKISDENYFALNIRSEFSLDERWKPNSTYEEFLKMRGFFSDGEQLRRIDLTKWADKIYVYHFLKENGIKPMPIIKQSYYLNSDIVEYAKEQFYAGKLPSFVIKTSHLGYGVSVIRVKDGKFITNDEHHKGNSRTGTRVDFDFIQSELERNWDRQQFGDEWACNILPPGIILEEFIENTMEIKYITVFGEVIGFMLQMEGFPSFDANGNSIDEFSIELPSWWKDGLTKAKEVAALVKADHIRIDLFYHKGDVVVCEITYNGNYDPIGLRDIITNKLNEGYALRAKYLQNK